MTETDTRRPAAPQGPYAYDLTASETQELTLEFLGSKCVPLGDRFVCFQIEGTDPFSNIARQVEREVFEDSWGNDPTTMKNEYGPYDESSVFFLTVDTHKNVPAGVLRMIRNSPAGLKTLVDLDNCIKSPIAPTAIPVDYAMRYHGIDDLDRCWDGATAAVPRRYRCKFATIYFTKARVVAAAALRENVQHLVAVLDAPIFKAAREVFGPSLVPLADTPPFTYMDAPNNQAVYAHVASTLAIAAKRNRKVGQKIRTCYGERNLRG
jgi:hypothetical protein